MIAEVIAGQQEQVIFMIKNDFAARSISSSCDSLSRCLRRSVGRLRKEAFKQIVSFAHSMFSFQQHQLKSAFALATVLSKVRSKVMVSAFSSIRSGKPGREEVSIDCFAFSKLQSKLRTAKVFHGWRRGVASLQLERVREKQMERMERLKHDSIQYMAFNTAYHKLNAKRKWLLLRHFSRWKQQPDRALKIANTALLEKESALTHQALKMEEVLEVKSKAERKVKELEKRLDLEGQNYEELQEQLRVQRREFSQNKASLQRDIDRQRLQLVKMQNELLEFKDDYDELKRGDHKLPLQQQIEAQRREISHLNNQLLESVNKVQGMAQDNALLKRECERLVEGMESAPKVASLTRTIDDLASDKQVLVEKLEVAVKDLTLLRNTYQNLNQENRVLREQLKKKERESEEVEERFRELEASQRGKGSLHLQRRLEEMEEYLQKVKGQNGELTKEVVRTTNELGVSQSKYEKLRLKNQNARQDKERAEQERDRLKQELQRAKNEISGLRHREAAQLRSWKEQNTKQITMLMAEKEDLQKRQSSERDHRQALLKKIEDQEREMRNLRERKQMTSDYLALKTEGETCREQLRVSRAEVDGLKKKLFALTQSAEAAQDKYEATESKLASKRKEVENLKGALVEKENETKTACSHMEQYVVVLEELEKKVKTNEQEKLQALRERDNALMEMRTIRERYKSVIVGAERFTHDFE